MSVPRAPLVAGACAVLALVAIKTSPLTFVDPDLWHQLSLAREIVRQGEVPRVDLFAYTPTLEPLVHHEWGAGLLWYGVASAGGAGGFLLVKYLLVAAVLALSVRAARRRGADAALLVACALPAAYLAHYGFTTIRAQLLTLAAVALLMNVLTESERRPALLWAWLPVHLLWQSVHAGFVVGLGFLGLATLERALRREPFAHHAAVTSLSAALVVLNPWGLEYVPYLIHGLTIDRSALTEWAPLWADLARRWPDLLCWAAMLALAAYAVRARGWRACRGLPLVALSLYFGLRHQRHVSLLAVTWLAVAAPWLDDTPLAARIRAFFTSRARLVTVLAGLGAALWLGLALLQAPWSLRLPSDPLARAEGRPTYPLGAAAYLERAGFEGRLMTPFVEGAYMMWRLQPQGVRISYDGRFEAAYPPAVTEAHTTFYGARPGWDAVLTRYPPDVVLLPRPSAILGAMLTHPGWRVVYGDDVYVLMARGGVDLPFVDARGRRVEAPFP